VLTTEFFGRGKDLTQRRKERRASRSLIFFAVLGVLCISALSLRIYVPCCRIRNFLPACFSSSATRLSSSAGAGWQSSDVWPACPVAPASPAIFRRRYVVITPDCAETVTPVADFQMSGKTGLSGEDDVFAELATAGDAHLRDDQEPSPIRRCARLHELSIFVPLPMTVGPSAPRSIVTFAPISTSSPMMTLQSAAPCGERRRLHVPKTVRANHRAGMNAHAPADFRFPDK